MRITLLAVAMALFASVLPVSAQAVMQHYQLNIPRQSLDSALRDFAHQTGLQVARFSDTIDGSAVVGPVTGELSAEQALKSLLGPSGLSFKMVNDRTIAIVKTGSAAAKPGLGTNIVQALTRQLQALIEIGDAKPGTAVSIVHTGIIAAQIADAVPFLTAV